MHGTGDRRFFDRVARLYDAVMWGADPARLRQGLERAERPIERVVDVGGGTGRAAAAIRGPDRLVVDASRPMLGRAADRGLAVVAADAARLPLADVTADAVLIVDALHHFPDAAGAIAEAARVLRPGGVLVVREFDPGTLRGRAIEFGEAVGGMGSTFYGPDDLTALVREAGLAADVVETGWTFTAVGVQE